LPGGEAACPLRIQSVSQQRTAESLSRSIRQNPRQSILVDSDFRLRESNEVDAATFRYLQTFQNILQIDFSLVVQR
jgi:hypothetical protein